MESDTRILNVTIEDERNRGKLCRNGRGVFCSGLVLVALLLPVSFLLQQRTSIAFLNHRSFSSLSIRVYPGESTNTANNMDHLPSPLPYNETGGLPAGVVWLASFPNSGTSYTISIVHTLTNKSTATNYGGNEKDDRIDSVPIYRDIPQGPYYRYPQEPWPEAPTHILTKTHCEQHTSGTLERFVASCATGTNFTGGSKINTTYPTSIVTGVVHLVRNPLDNIVARMNYQRGIWEKGKEENDLKKASFFPLSFKGFYWWCQYKDNKKSQAHEVLKAQDNGTFYEEYLKPVPCWIEFYLYFRWHNLMVEMLSADSQLQNRPSMILYYEDYQDPDHAQAQVQRLLSFLQADPQLGFDHIPEFETHEPYDFFSPDERAALKRLAQVMTTPTTWSLLQHYFDDEP